MEASGFMHSALRFSSAELVQGLKVISDNRHQQSGRKAQVLSDLIHGNMPSIARQAQALTELARELEALVPAADSWQRLLQLAHFSQTQQNRARGLWRYLLLRQHDSEELLQQLCDAGSAAAIIDRLEQQSRRDSARL